MTELLVKEFGFLAVLEGSSELCLKIKVRFGDRVRVHEGFLETFKPSQPYDSIFLVHTLEHTDDQILALSSIKTWLVPRGKIFIAAPNANSLSRRIAVKMGKVEYLTSVTDVEKNFGHTVTFNADTLAYVVKKAGFKIIKSGGVLLKTLANF